MGDVSLVYCLHCDRNCLKQHYQWSKFYYKFSNYSYYFIIISLFKQHDRWTVIICRRRQRSHGSGLVPAEWSSAARLTRISTRSITSGVLRCRSRVMPSVRIQNNVSSSSGTSATRRSNPLTSKHNHHIDIYNGSFHLSFWISLSLRTKTETKRLSFGLSPELSSTNHRSASPQRVIADVISDSSLISPYFFVYFWIREKVKWFSLIKT